MHTYMHTSRQHNKVSHSTQLDQARDPTTYKHVQTYRRNGTQPHARRRVFQYTWITPGFGRIAALLFVHRFWPLLPHNRNTLV